MIVLFLIVSESSNGYKAFKQKPNVVFITDLEIDPVSGIISNIGGDNLLVAHNQAVVIKSDTLNVLKFGKNEFIISPGEDFALARSNELNALSNVKSNSLKLISDSISIYQPVKLSCLVFGKISAILITDTSKTNAVTFDIEHQYDSEVKKSDPKVIYELAKAYFETDFSLDTFELIESDKNGSRFVRTYTLEAFPDKSMTVFFTTPEDGHAKIGKEIFKTNGSPRYIDLDKTEKLTIVSREPYIPCVALAGKMK